MLKSIVRTLFVSIFLIPLALAEDTLSAFHQQGDFSYEEPMSEQSYFATLAPLPPRTSGYVGFSLGGGLIPLKGHFMLDNNNDPAEIASFEIKDTLGATAGIYLGYGTNFDRFYLATELNVNYNFLGKTIKGEVGGHLVHLRVRQPMVASLDLIPGYLNSTREILFYGRLGLATSLYKLNFKDTTETEARDNSSNKVALGLNAGAGVEFFTSDSFSFRIEYLYSLYHRVEDTYNSVYLYGYKLNATVYHRINLGFSIHY